MNTVMDINFYQTSLQTSEMQKSMMAQQGFSSSDNTKELRALDESKEGLKKAATAFEGIFINLLFKEMRKTVNQEEGILPPSNSQKIFQEMLDEEISTQLSKKNSFGIADSVVRTYGKKLESSTKGTESKKPTFNQLA